MRRIGLIQIERINKITLKLIELREERHQRSISKPHPRVGKWKHELSLAILDAKIKAFEQRRFEEAGLHDSR